MTLRIDGVLLPAGCTANRVVSDFPNRDVLTIHSGSPDQGGLVEDQYQKQGVFAAALSGFSGSGSIGWSDFPDIPLKITSIPSGRTECIRGLRIVGE